MCTLTLLSRRRLSDCVIALHTLLVMVVMSVCQRLALMYAAACVRSEPMLGALVVLFRDALCVALE